MKKLCKSSVAVMIAMIMVFGGAPLGALAGLIERLSGLSITAQAVHTWAVGDIGTFGSYPQTRVTDETLLTSLNSQTPTWVSYGYYIGTDDYGTMTQSDYMMYADVTYGGIKYRAVKFTSYRPNYTYYLSSSAYSYQDDNGYFINTVYWFKYEPIKWRVLDPDKGLLLCEIIIDSQAYSNTIYRNASTNEYFNNADYTVYANDYATSSVRTWLNDDFYNTAFTNTEQSRIMTTHLNNRANTRLEAYHSDDTYDKLFFLSYNDSINKSYGFSPGQTVNDIARRSQGSDYAKCQGLYVYNSSGENYGNSKWWRRSPTFYSFTANYVFFSGTADSGHCVDGTDVGVRPAFYIASLSYLNSASSGAAQSDEALTTVEMTKPAIEKETEMSPLVVTMLIIVGVAVLTATGIGFFLYRRKTH